MGLGRQAQGGLVQLGCQPARPTRPGRGRCCRPGGCQGRQVAGCGRAGIGAPRRGVAIQPGHRRHGLARIEGHRLGRRQVEISGPLGGRRRRPAGDGWRAAALLAGELGRIAHHLHLDLVDLGLDPRIGPRADAVLGQSHLGVIDLGRPAQRGQLLGRQAIAAQPAQGVELALAHKIVAPFALDHGLELDALDFQVVISAGVHLGPVGGRVGDKAHHLAEEALAVLGVGHGVSRRAWPGPPAACAVAGGWLGPGGGRSRRARGSLKFNQRESASIAKHLLLHLAALLGLKRQRGGGPCKQPAQADGLTGFVTKTVVTGFDAAQ